MPSGLLALHGSSSEIPADKEDAMKKSAVVLQREDVMNWVHELEEHVIHQGLRLILTGLPLRRPIWSDFGLVRVSGKNSKQRPNR